MTSFRDNKRNARQSRRHDLVFETLGDDGISDIEGSSSSESDWEEEDSDDPDELSASEQYDEHDLVAETLRADYRTANSSGRPQKSHHSMSDESLDVAMAFKCPCQCLSHFSRRDVQACRERLVGLTESAVQQWLVGYMRDNCSGQNKYVFKVNSRPICQHAFACVYDLSKYKFRSARHVLKHGGHLQLSRSLQVRANINEQWMVDGIQDILELLTETTVAGRMLLPRCVSKSGIWRQICERHQEEGRAGQPPSLSAFYIVYREHFAHIKRAPRGEWSHCKKCAELQQQKKRWSSSLEEKKTIDEEIRNHIVIFKGERAGFERRRKLAETKPGEYNLITIDYTNSAVIPFRHPSNSAIRSAKRINFNMGGAIEFSSGRRYIFLHDSSVAKDGSMLATELLMIIRDVKSSGLASSNAQTLFLQTDGGSENCNKILFALLQTLVDKGMYQKVYFNRMVVGHTHSQVDQFFRHPRSKLVSTNMSTLGDVVRTIRSSFVSPGLVPQVCWVERPFNFKEFFKPHLVPLHSHHKVLGLVFVKENGQSGFRYKNVPEQEKEWLGALMLPNGKLLRVISSVPPGMPAPIDCDVSYEAKFQRDLQKAISSHVTPSQKEWITSYLTSGSAGFQFSWAKSSEGTIGSSAVSPDVSCRAIVDVPSDLWCGAWSPSSPESSSSQPMASFMRHNVRNNSVPPASKTSAAREMKEVSVSGAEQLPENDLDKATAEEPSNKRRRSSRIARKGSLRPATASSGVPASIARYQDPDMTEAQVEAIIRSRSRREARAKKD